MPISLPPSLLLPARAHFSPLFLSSFLPLSPLPPLSLSLPLPPIYSYIHLALSLTWPTLSISSLCLLSRCPCALLPFLPRSIPRSRCTSSVPAKSPITPHRRSGRIGRGNGRKWIAEILLDRGSRARGPPTSLITR